MTDIPFAPEPDDEDRAPVTWIALFVLLFATVAIVAYPILPSGGDGGQTSSRATEATYCSVA